MKYIWVSWGSKTKMDIPILFAMDWCWEYGPWVERQVVWDNCNNSCCKRNNKNLFQNLNSKRIYLEWILCSSSTSNNILYNAWNVPCLNENIGIMNMFNLMPRLILQLYLNFTSMDVWKGRYMGRFFGGILEEIKTSFIFHIYIPQHMIFQEKLSCMDKECYANGY